MASAGMACRQLLDENFCRVLPGQLARDDANLQKPHKKLSIVVQLSTKPTEKHH